jgi:hypothetical protein
VALLGILGSVLLLVGAFVPIAPGHLGVGHDYFENDHRNLMAILAALSFVFTWVFRWYRLLWATGLLALLVGVVAWLRFQGSLAGQNPPAVLSWTWSIHVAGVALILAAALWAEIDHRQAAMASGDSNPDRTSGAWP